jgi:pyruvate, water dikinase
MTRIYTLMSTGLNELDKVIQGIRPGDNVVWQVDSIEDYIRFVHPFCRKADESGGPLIYFRFAGHVPVVPADVKATVYQLHPEDGFESFIAEIFTVIEKSGHGAYYVFDLLSELSVDWYSDSMLGNFFMLACPYLNDYDTAAYFALLRNRHTPQTVKAIHDTAQVTIDVYSAGGEIYVQPLKVFTRHTDTMYMLHQWRGDDFKPVTQSAVISGILERMPHKGLNPPFCELDMWNRIFARAREIQDEVGKGAKRGREYEEYRQRLLRMVVTRDSRLLGLAEKYFTLADLIDIGSHMIGTGLVGGKTVGMLLARAILRKKSGKWAERLEPHDSFFIGSDVFYTYLINSKCWWLRWKQRHGRNYLEGTEETHKRLINGNFPEEIQSKFKEILNYYGQSPIIVRSSSLLEDAYGNSFSGKYESIFCANQGTPEERLADFIGAVKRVYASTMSKDALQYRYLRGLLDRDEQMALLVQRVSGAVYGKFFFPQVAGVGFSYNLYAWSKEIDPKAGVLRLVFGLGTRAVNRSDDDYTRIVAVNEPLKRPETDFNEVKKYAQRKMDLLDLKENRFKSDYFSDIAGNLKEFPVDLFASRDREVESFMRERNRNDLFPYVITFENLFQETSFVVNLKEILKALQDAYDYPVDIEFTANFLEGNDFRINLLQCRPYQVKQDGRIVKEPRQIKKGDTILSTKGPVIGSSLHSEIDRLIFVVPAAYSALPEKDKYMVATLIGKVAGLTQKGKTIMLLGPGRWCTTTPSLGVPAQFREISNVSVLCEIAEMHEGLIPDVSLGTHFFNDLVELDILYLAVYPDTDDNFLNREFLMNTQNNLAKLLPDAAGWSGVIRVIDYSASNAGETIYLHSNSVEQRGICYKRRAVKGR